MTFIPHRHSERSVFRFVPIITKLLNHHASRGSGTVSFNPLELNISVETAVARLRDAVFSLSTGLTAHPSVDAVTLKEVWKQYKVTSDGTNVQVIPRATEQGELLTITGDSKDVLASLNVEDVGFAENLSAFATLLGRRLLQGQVIINGDLSDNLKRTLECDNDVVITQNAPKQYYMI
jgi:hypothetical protein